MARYNLLTDDERRRLFDIPIDRAALIQHYTLAPEELELSWPGTVTETASALRCNSACCGTRASACATGRECRTRCCAISRRSSLLRQRCIATMRVDGRPERHAKEVTQRLGLRASRRADRPLMVDIAAEAAWSTDHGLEIADALMAGLRERKFILPAPGTIEHAGATGPVHGRGGSRQTPWWRR